MLLGEVHTGLLRNSTAVSAGMSANLLGLKPGVAARHGERPVRHAISPELFTGVDCDLASAQSGLRAIGTVSTRAIIIGGQVLQGSSHVDAVSATMPRRQPWSHYLARLGAVEVIGRWQAERVGTGFLRAPAPPSTLDLGSINTRLWKVIQSSPGLDARSAFRAQVTRVRWVARMAEDRPAEVSFRVEPNSLRTIELWLPPTDREDVVAACEDLALHDWLLTTVVKLIDQSRIGAAPRREIINRLVPALDFLLHLWMPGARLAEPARSIWAGLDERAGVTRQWQAAVTQIRDQLSLATITRLTSPHVSDHS